ncbi:MAG: insulinase family protein, partial [Gemmatimonadaceae bacterium]|nr:insulinase family protein [Gemmatimonadaceae bacterium]
MARLRRFISSRAALAAVLLGIARAAAAQTPVSLAELLPVDTAVRTGRLANGLTYYIRHNGVPGKRAELRLVVNAGSALEDDDQKGVAHLLEHLAFDGSTHFPGHEMWDYLERLGMRGGADVNASTSFDETVYRIAIPTDSAEVVTRGLQMLGDWMHGLALDSAELERERKVVVEEWRVREGAASRISTQQLAVIALGSPYPDHTPMQPADVMARASLAAVRRFYHDWYRPDLMAVVIVGDVDPAALEARVRRMYSAIPAPAHPRPRPAITVPVDSAPRISVVTDAEATATSVTVLVTRPAVPERTVGDVRRGIVAEAADAMLTARLTDLAHQAGAPMLDVAMGHGSIVRPLAFHQFSARAADGGVQRALRALLAEAARVQRSGFTATELERQTRAIRLSYDQLEAQRDRIPSATYADRLVNEFLTGAPAVPLERAVAIGRRLVSTITLDDVRRALADLVAGPGRIILVSAPAAATALPSVAELR